MYFQGDTRLDRRRFLSERTKDISSKTHGLYGIGARRGSDGCLVTANPMVSGGSGQRCQYQPILGPCSRTTLPSTSSEDESRNREAMPLMEIGRRERSSGVVSSPQDSDYDSSVTAPPPPVNCQVEVLSNGCPSSPPQTRVTTVDVSTDGSYNTHWPESGSSVSGDPKVAVNGYVPEIQSEPLKLACQSGSKHSVHNTRDRKHVTIQLPTTSQLL